MPVTSSAAGFRTDDRSSAAPASITGNTSKSTVTDLDAFLPSLGSGRFFCLSAHAARPYTQIAYQPGDCLLFGGETRGLPAEFLQRHTERTITIPMPAGKVRSLNLATAVGIVLYEGLRQLHRW